MAIVLVDNEAFKITLQIVEDFISDDYDAFIENGPTDDIKLITWKMEIYFKKLEGKKKSIVEYYMIPIYKYIEAKLYYLNGDTFIYAQQNNGNERYRSFNALSIDLEKNFLNKTITLKFICDEKRKNSYCTYLIQIRDILHLLMSSYKFYDNLNTHKYYEISGSIVTNKSIELDNDDYKVLWLKDIIKAHYQEILKNIEAYILYCKTEKIDIDFKKIVDRITFIKEYVRENYNITLV